jgi:hypothetical protein
MGSKRRCLVLAALVGALLAIPNGALAKGATSATIQGPGLSRPIIVAGEGEPGTDGQLAELSTRAGLFAAMFGSGADQGELLTARPAGNLGPRYTVRYTVPVDDNASVQVVQDLYPYAVGGAVTWTSPGQPLWSDQKVVGGWFRAPATLQSMLVSLGLPRRPSAGASSAAAKPAGQAPAEPVAQAAAGTRAGNPALAWWLGAPLLLGVLLAAAVTVVRRRRPAR